MKLNWKIFSFSIETKSTKHKKPNFHAQKLIGSKFANKATGYNFNINLGQDTSAAIASALVDAKLSNI